MACKTIHEDTGNYTNDLSSGFMSVRMNSWISSLCRAAHLESNADTQAVLKIVSVAQALSE